MPFETIVMFTLPPYCKGVPDPAMTLTRESVPLPTHGKPFDEAYGKLLAEWSNKQSGKKGIVTFITRDQGAEINMALKSAALLPEALFTHFNIKRLGELRADQVNDVKTWIASHQATETVDETTGEISGLCPLCGETDSHLITCPDAVPPPED